MNNSNNKPEDRDINSKLDRILNENTSAMFEGTKSVKSQERSNTDPTIDRAKSEINEQADSMLREIEERRRRRAQRQMELEKQVRAEDEMRKRYENNGAYQPKQSMEHERIKPRESEAKRRTSEPLERFSSAPSRRGETRQAPKKQRRTVSVGETQIMPKVTDSRPQKREKPSPQRQRTVQHSARTASNAPTRSNRDRQNNKNSNSKEVNLMKEIREWVVALALAVVVALLVRNFVFTLVKVQGESMSPTLSNNDRLYVNKFFYSPKKGDVVIFKPASDPDRPYIKRVIATEGDTVYIDFETGDVYVNGDIIAEPYIKEKTARSGSYINGLIAKGEYSKDNPIVVEKNKIFVMGDNRNNSTDSRMIGQVPEDEIVGGAVFRFYPLGNFGSVNYDMSYLIEDDNGEFIVCSEEAA